MYYLCSENKGAYQLRIFVFAYAKSRFSHDAAHVMNPGIKQPPGYQAAHPTVLHLPIRLNKPKKRRLAPLFLLVNFVGVVRPVDIDHVIWMLTLTTFYL